MTVKSLLSFPWSSIDVKSDWYDLAFTCKLVFCFLYSLPNVLVVFGCVGCMQGALCIYAFLVCSHISHVLCAFSDSINLIALCFLS